MKKISNQYKTKNIGTEASIFWLRVAQACWLLMFLIRRSKYYLYGIFFHDPDKPISQLSTSQTIAYPNKTNNQNASIMKSVNRTIKWLAMLLIATVWTNAVMAQTGPYPQTGDHSVCINDTKLYGVIDVPTSTFVWSVAPGVAGTDWVITSTGHNTISIKWLKTGTYTVQVQETSGANCIGDPKVITVIVNPLPVCFITGPNNICPGSTNIYNAPTGMATYSWSISGNATIPGATNGQTVSVLANNSCGSYTLTLTITDANGCTNTCNEEFDITAPPIVLTAPSNISATK